MPDEHDNPSVNTPRPIPTRYAGCHFRSRLEARWAVFFDALGVTWRYEDQGYQLPSGWYLPDFFLPTCATFVEVRADRARVDVNDLIAKTNELPALQPDGGERGPRLLLLGPIPAPRSSPHGDYGWWAHDGRYGFDAWSKNLRPWWHATTDGDETDLLTPTVAPHEWGARANEAYAAARSARFEHGHSGPS